MRLSVNELEILARKAAVGAGVDYGYAVEAAQSLVWLRAAGVDCVAGFLDCLRAWVDGGTAQVTPAYDQDRCILSGPPGQTASALYAAAAVSDFSTLMIKESHFSRVEVRNVELPCLVLAQLARQPWAGGLAVRCLEPGGAPERWTALIRARREAPTVSVAGDVTGGRSALVRVAAGELSHPAAGGPAPAEAVWAPDFRALFARGASIEPDHYEALRQFYDRTLVPDSDASRLRGAGAGLVDSD